MTSLGSLLHYLIHGGRTARMMRRPPRHKKRRGPVLDPKYRAFVREHACCCCGSWKFVEAAHIGPHAYSQKASDRMCAPLCSKCHRTEPWSLHQLGRQRFEAMHYVDLIGVVVKLNEEYGQELPG